LPPTPPDDEEVFYSFSVPTPPEEEFGSIYDDYYLVLGA
jgi:hypothetical protein